MLVAAYRLVDYLDAFIVVEGENLVIGDVCQRAESVGRVWRSSSGGVMMAASQCNLSAFHRRTGNACSTSSGR